ncbi:PHB depolymerase family esterase [Microlunatus soli]|uniref:Esterase PHB depolymerase n=1 Tax=Microlunatus soli TaxID=630515 RepID=A0A1H1PCP7_9ACTN|nr:PHB depolymerase family esterase [Microlunatus soli]SDS08897.1 Esterase PHB depolymerase [Microlunatus soli]
MTDTKVKDTRNFYRTGATPLFACRSDQRFSYCLYVPHAHRDATEPLPLVVIMHGTGRMAPQYRDAFADFAEQHDCVVLAPLFPAGIDDPDDLHNFKFIEYHGIRFDLIMLDMVDEVSERYRVNGRRFLLHGFSGGGQFTHRMLYLHPDRLAAASIGAPGRITRLDPDTAWWLGTRDLGERFGRSVDTAAIREVPVQMIVGDQDVETWEINNPGDSNWMPGVEATGDTRIARLQTLQRDFEAHDIAVRFDLVPGIAHDGLGVLPTVQEFFTDVLSRS